MALSSTHISLMAQPDKLIKTPEIPFLEGGAVGTLLQKREWTAFALGHPDSWPVPLQTVVSLMLQTPGPAFVCWGPDLAMFYNDAYVEFLEDKHPSALGQPLHQVWPEIWDEIEPLTQRAMRGESVDQQHTPFTLHRKGRAEEGWFTFAYIPVRDMSGTVAGFYAPVSETTAEVVANMERRQETYRLRSLLHQAPSVIAVFRGPQHIYELVSPSYCEYFGVKDVVGKKLGEVLPGLQAQGFIELLDRVYQDGEPYIGRALPFDYVKSEDGSTELCYFDLYYQPIRDEQGRVNGILAEGIDVTEAVQKNMALRASEQRLLLLDAIGEVTRSISTPDEVMAATTRLLGEHLNVSRCAYADVDDDGDAFTIRRDWTAPGHPSSAGHYALHLFGPHAEASMRGGRALIIHDLDAEVRQEDGAGMFNDLGIKAIICCPLNKDGRLKAMMAVHAAQPRQWSAEEVRLVKDVVDRSWAHIERMRAMEGLRESREHYAALFAHSAAGVAETNLTGVFVQANDKYCAILDRAREDVIGAHMIDFTHPDDRERNVPLFLQVVKEGTPFELEKRYVRPDGSPVWVSVSVTRVGSAEPGKGSILATVTDISERKQAEQRLREEARRKDDFLAMLAHELRNPLAPIRAAAELLQLADLDGARLRQTSQIIARQVNHMTDLVDDLLDVSRVTRGLATINMAPQDMKTVVSNAVEQVRPIVEARRHQLTITIEPAPAWVLCDDKRLVQVLTNLIHNSAKYTPEGGRINVEMQVRSEEVTLSVIDNGIGIPVELQPRVFDAFSQAERTPDRSQGGLGLGLSLVKSLVEFHGGRVECHSQGQGRGSRFTVTMPRIATPSASPDTAVLKVPHVEADRALRILVVDDNIDAAAMLGMLLETFGHDVMVAHRADVALEQAARHRPEVCFMDIGLPVMDGLELARRLRARPETAGAVLVAVTGYGQVRDREATASAGFNYHLVKPVSAAQLREVLGDVLGGVHSGSPGK